MERQKRAKAQGAAGPAALDPEARAGWSARWPGWLAVLATAASRPP